MVTRKVAGRVRQHPPAVMFPQNGQAPEAHAVKVPHERRNPRATASAVLFDALAAALFCGLIVALIIVVCGGLMLAAPR